MTLEPPFAFIDFEASALIEGSWPIEFGWAIVRPNRTIESASYLIQPAPHWDMAYWSDESQKVHGITIDDLQKEGLAPKVVA
ncbi:MAG: hypothetical protein HWE25_08450 [Alphaproteobacteria bacterium]|nr:hypothetical protein [Alphaproteobacteria bacterium]